jgi:hypothetical protein
MGQHHEWQQIVDHADHYAGTIEDHFEMDRPIRQRGERPVDEALVTEHDHEGETLHQDAGPEWQHDHDEIERPPPRARMCDVQRDHVAENEADQRR